MRPLRGTEIFLIWVAVVAALLVDILIVQCVTQEMRENQSKVFEVIESVMVVSSSEDTFLVGACSEDVARRFCDALIFGGDYVQANWEPTEDGNFKITAYKTKVGD